MSLSSATGISVDTRLLSETGTLLRVAVRVVAPVFTTLSVLSLRSRVRRQQQRVD